MSCCASIVPIFQGLDENSLQMISDLAIHRNLPVGTVLNFPTKHQGLFIIASGKVKVYSLTSSGHEQLIRILEPGDFTGLELLFGVDSNQYAEAVTEIMTCSINQKDFIHLLELHPSISIKLLKLYSQQLAEVEQRLLDNSLEFSTKRIAHYLIKLSKEYNQTLIQIPLPLKELAHFLSMSPETLSRSLRELEETSAICKIKNRCYQINLELFKEE